jgi:signal-transduction protein with cAMP-binding, CBS, and nucleotidyltransferase domain
VIDAMLTLTVHRLFVTHEDGEVLGVISAIDVLRHLHQQQAPAFGQAEGPVPSR